MGGVYKPAVFGGAGQPGRSANHVPNWVIGVIQWYRRAGSGEGTDMSLIVG